MSVDLVGFVAEIRSILAQYTFSEEQGDYLEISAVTDFNGWKIPQSLDQLPPPDPLVDALALILDSMRQGPFELTRYGVNELLLSYLSQVNEENQEACTKKYLQCIYQIFLCMNSQDYPFQDLLWEYLSQCFNAISKYLLEHRLADGCQAFLTKVATMGKSAAAQGLHTSSIQHFLHNLEMRAREEGFDELADSAKNYRFNLETF